MRRLNRVLWFITSSIIILSIVGCGNTSMREGLTSKSNTLRYAVIEQNVNGSTHRVLYTVDTWSHSESDAFAIKYTRNGKSQILWASLNVMKIYHDIPEKWEYDYTFEEMHDF